MGVEIGVFFCEVLWCGEIVCVDMGCVVEVVCCECVDVGC